MDLNYLKEQAIQYALLCKKGKKTLTTALAGAEKDLLGDYISGLKRRKEEAEKKIEELVLAKHARLEDLKRQQDEISVNSTSEIASHIEFLKHEKVQIDELVSGTAALVENLPDFHKSFQENIDKINGFITGLNDLNREIRKDADSYVQDYKREIKKEVEQKKEELNSDLKAYYEEQKKTIEDNLNNEANGGHKKQYFGKEGAESYDTMKKKGLFIGYTIIILLSIAIVLIDYAMIRMDISKALGSGRMSTWWENFISNIIAPGIFSFGILVYGIVEKKIIESRFWKIFANFVIYTSSAVLLVLPPLVGHFTSGGTYDFNETEGIKILVRFFVYFMLLPICIYLIGKFFTWEYMHIYISNIVYGIKWFFKKLFYPFGKLFGLFEKKMLINVSGFGIKFRGKPMNELEEKTEHLNVLYNNVNKIDNQVRDIKSKCNEIVKGLKGSNKVFNQRVKNLNDNLSKAYKELNRELEELERINNKYIHQIDSQIDDLAEGLGIDEENLSNEREAIRQGILEVYNRDK